MKTNDSKSSFPSLPPVMYVETTRRVGWLSIIFSAFYLYHFANSLLGALINDFEGTGIPIYVEVLAELICFGSLSTGGFLLLKENLFGKRLIAIAGFAGSITILVFGIWAVTFFWTAPYNQYPLIVLENFARLVLRFAIRFAYPIIATIILLNKTDTELGLN